MASGDLIDEAKGFFTTRFDGVIRVELVDEDTSFWVDGRAQPPAISVASPKEVTRQFCLWRIEGADLSLILLHTQGRLENSVIAGRLRLSGDMSVMMRLEAVLHG